MLLFKYPMLVYDIPYIILDHLSYLIYTLNYYMLLYLKVS
jgi:hypothetical protein